MNDQTISSPPIAIPAIGAFYHLPPVWVGSVPSQAEIDSAPMQHFSRDVYGRTLHHEIRARVRWDGLFVFDCTKWPDAGPTLVPGYSIRAGGTVPRDATRAEEAAESRAGMRFVLMNAFQACLSTAHYDMHQRSTSLGAPVRPHSAVRLLDLADNSIGGLNRDIPIQRYLADLASFQHGNRRALQEHRVLLELDTVGHAFDVLDRLLQSEIEDHLQLVEIMFRAGAQCADSSFAESVILSWSVCERLLQIAWQRYIKQRGKERVTKKRREKLAGRDYASAVILETLELAGVLPPDLYEMVDETRRLRNAWLHSLAKVEPIDTVKAISAARFLMRHVTGVEITVSFGWSGSTGGLDKRYVRDDWSIDWEMLSSEARRVTGGK